MKKAKAGHVTGGRTFGYTNERVDAAQAAVVRRIYEAYASGSGLSTIAHGLNLDGAPTPRAQQGRVDGWCTSSVREVLKQPLYRGEIQWNRARKRDRSGRMKWSKRPPSEGISVPCPELRIVPEELAAAVDARRESLYARALRLNDGRLMGRPAGEGSPYLMTGLLACGVCGGGMEVLSTKSGQRRTFHYRCYVARRKGPACCTNTQPVRMEEADDAVLSTIEAAILNPAVLDAALAHAEAALTRERRAVSVSSLRSERTKIEHAISRLTTAIATGGELDPLVAALKIQEARRKEIDARLHAATSPTAIADLEAIRRKLKGYLGDWRGLLRANVHQGQQVLRRLVVGRITFTPQEDGGYAFEGKGSVRPLLSGVVCKLASPTGFEPVF